MHSSPLPSGKRVALQLGVVMSDIALRAADELEPLVGAVTYKRYRPEARFRAARPSLETSLSIIEANLASGLDRLGTWTLLDERPLHSISFDIGPAALRVGEESSANGYPRFTLRGPRLGAEEYLARARDNAAWLRGRFSGMLRLENLNYFHTADGAYDDVCSPDFIGRVLDAVDAELLLDIGHAVISSANLEVPVDFYLNALPLARVGEVHLSACGTLDGVWEDLHEAPGEREWGLLEWIVSQAPVQCVTVEYYRDAGTLVDIYRQLARRFTVDTR